MKRKKKDQKVKDALEKWEYKPMAIPQPSTKVRSFRYDSNGDLEVTVGDGWGVPGPWSPVSDVPERHRDALRSWLGVPTEGEMKAAAATLSTWLSLHDLAHNGPVPCVAHDEGQWCCVDRIENVGRTPDNPDGTRPNPIREALDTLVKGLSP